MSGRGKRPAAVPVESKGAGSSQLPPTPCTAAVYCEQTHNLPIGQSGYLRVGLAGNGRAAARLTAQRHPHRRCPGSVFRVTRHDAAYGAKHLGEVHRSTDIHALPRQHGRRRRRRNDQLGSRRTIAHTVVPTPGLRIIRPHELDTADNRHLRLSRRRTGPATPPAEALPTAERPALSGAAG